MNYVINKLKNIIIKSLTPFVLKKLSLSEQIAAFLIYNIFMKES